VESGSSSHSYRWVVWLAVIVPIVLVLLSGSIAAVALPGCDSCHDTGTFKAQTKASSHSQVECASCHVPSAPLARLGFGFRQVFHMVIPLVDSRGREWASVPNESCLSCHEKISENIVSVNGIKIDHSVCAKDAQCTDCHSTVAHGTATSWPRVYDMETCLECHAPKGIAKCDTCHVGKRPTSRITSGVFATTHGPQWKTTHGMGNSSTCTACHSGDTCIKCHGPGLPHGPEFIETHPQIAATPAAKCTSCHEPSFCADCHGLQMPHSRKFTRGHAAPAKADPDLCERCHAPSDCVTCHETHVHPGGAVSGDTPLPPGKSGE